MCMVFKVWGSFTIPTAESVKNARTVIFARVAKKKTQNTVSAQLCSNGIQLWDNSHNNKADTHSAIIVGLYFFLNFKVTSHSLSHQQVHFSYQIHSLVSQVHERFFQIVLCLPFHNDSPWQRSDSKNISTENGFFG